MGEDSVPVLFLVFREDVGKQEADESVGPCFAALWSTSSLWASSVVAEECLSSTILESLGKGLCTHSSAATISVSKLARFSTIV